MVNLQQKQQKSFIIAKHFDSFKIIDYGMSVDKILDKIDYYNFNRKSGQPKIGYRHQALIRQIVRFLRIDLASLINNDQDAYINYLKSDCLPLQTNRGQLATKARYRSKYDTDKQRNDARSKVGKDLSDLEAAGFIVGRRHVGQGLRLLISQEWLCIGVQKDKIDTVLAQNEPIDYQGVARTDVPNTPPSPNEEKELKNINNSSSGVVDNHNTNNGNSSELQTREKGTAKGMANFGQEVKKKRKKLKRIFQEHVHGGHQRDEINLRLPDGALESAAKRLWTQFKSAILPEVNYKLSLRENDECLELFVDLIKYSMLSDSGKEKIRLEKHEVKIGYCIYILLRTIRKNKETGRTRPNGDPINYFPYGLRNYFNIDRKPDGSFQFETMCFRKIMDDFYPSERQFYQKKEKGNYYKRQTNFGLTLVEKFGREFRNMVGVGGYFSFQDSLVLMRKHLYKIKTFAERNSLDEKQLNKMILYYETTTKLTDDTFC